MAIKIDRINSSGSNSWMLRWGKCRSATPPVEKVATKDSLRKLVDENSSSDLEHMAAGEDDSSQ
jgi:hypothetical protein